jgi:DNA polymerase I-like protein with 3'-5' exonuclease and polymerase domains
MYGMGKNKLANELGLNREEGDKIISRYNRKVPFVKLLSDRCMKKADEEGVIRTKLGRKCRFDMWEPRDWGLWTSETFENAVATYLYVSHDHFFSDSSYFFFDGFHINSNSTFN